MSSPFQSRIPSTFDGQMYKIYVTALYNTAWCIFCVGIRNIPKIGTMIISQSGYRSYPIVLIIGRRITYVNYSVFSYKLFLRTIFRHHNMEDFLVGNLHTLSRESPYISY